MSVVLVLSVVLGVECFNNLLTPVMAEDGGISHPLPPDIEDKIVAAADIAINQKDESNYSDKNDATEAVDGHGISSLQSSLSSMQSELTSSKNDLNNGLTDIQLSQTGLRNETAELRENYDSGLTELQSSLTGLRNETAELRKNYDSALATLALLQHSLSATKEELSTSKMDLESVSSTVTELTSKANNSEKGISSLQSSLSSMQSELTSSKNDFNNGLTDIQSSLTELRDETAELRKNYDSALATLALLQRSLSATKEELKTSKMGLEYGISSLQSSLSSMRSEITASRNDFNNGLTNIQSSLTELRKKTAELQKNYDSEKCKDGWTKFGVSCYFFSTSRADWVDGRQTCLNMGADYVKISSDDEFDFLRSKITEDTWIGLRYNQWISDGSVHIKNSNWWVHNQPNNADNQFPLIIHGILSVLQKCVLIDYSNGKKLNYGNCPRSTIYICEMMPFNIVQY